jgi:hypothetical protein
MSEPERFDFESHYFDCEECAVDVRAVHALAKGVKEVCAEEPVPARVHTLPGAGTAPRKWWSSWLVPAFATGAAVLAAYQGVVIIPGLRSETQSQAVTPIVLKASARGEDQPVDLKKKQPFSVVWLDVNYIEPGTSLKYDVVNPEGKVQFSRPAIAPPNATPLLVTLWQADLVRPGDWLLVLRDQKGAEVSRYPFSVLK